MKLINETRKLEIFKISLGQYLYALSLGLFFVVLKIVTYTCLVSFILLGNHLNGEIVFLSLAILNKISFLSLYNAHFMRHTVNGLVSSKRITKFLLLPESTNDPSQKADWSPASFGSAKVQIKNLFATYQSISDSKFDKLDLTITLHNINFECKSGELVTVVAPVGGGKSSILNAILKEMNTLKGSVEVEGRVSYASQEAVLFAGTLKENIIFGTDYDEQKYKEVVRVCGLEHDFTLLPQGENTCVDNTRSVALSGGQRARLNLARTLYYDADIYLLDDPISAVDSHTAKHIFREAIRGYLSEKIVILATHQLQFLTSSSKILLLNNGQQVAFGDYQMLSENLHKMEFAKHAIDDKKKGDEKKADNDDSIDVLLDKSANKSKEKTEKRQIIKEVTTLEFSSKVYYVYLKLGLSGWLGPVLVVTLVLAQFVFSFSDYFLSLWTTVEEQRFDGKNETNFVEHLNQSQRIWIYNGLMIGLLCLGLLRSYLFFKACMQSSRKLHQRLFNSVVRSPISFFETNPIGILLNRVSRDCGIVDDILPVRFFDAVDIAVINIGIAILMVYLEPYLIIPLGFLFVGVYLLRKLYVRTAKFVKMLEGVTKSPVVSLLSSTIDSLPTIRAFRAQERFKSLFDRQQNDHSSAFFLYSSGMTWFVHAIENLEVLIIAVILVIIIQASQLTGSSVGVIVSSLVLFCHGTHFLTFHFVWLIYRRSKILLSTEFQWNIKNWCDVETFLTSVSRLDQYSKLKEESALESAPDKKPSPHWPKYGSIEFRNVSMKYYEDEPPVLKNLNFTIHPQDNVGIIGRTGAGKSSILNILFRLNEYDGEILIDGVNIGEIGLHDLRSKFNLVSIFLNEQF